jgi:hypothetical protein
MSAPTVAELEAATAATEAAIESGDLVDVYLAVEAEEAAYEREHGPGPCDRASDGPHLDIDGPELEAEAEAKL